LAELYYLNKAISALFDILLLPFGRLHPAAGLVFLSVLAGLLMLVIFKKTSNQRGLRAARDRMQGRLYEMRLFGGDPVATLRAAGALLADNARYLRFIVVPTLAMIVPFFILYVQLEARYGLRPAAPGEPIIVSAKPGNILLKTDGDIRIETAPLRIGESGETDWRVSADKPGRHMLRFEAGGQNVEKEFVAGSGVKPVWPARAGGGVMRRLLNPGEPPPGNGIYELRVNYPRRQIIITGRQAHWLVIFFVVSLAAAFAFKKLFRVEI
jgi:hypothetical protein